MGTPTYFPTQYFGGPGETAPSTGTPSTVVSLSTGGRRFPFVELYATRLDYELGTNDSAVLFTSARRKASINEGLREFADLTQCWTRESTIGIVTGQASYNLHSTVNIPSEDFLRVTADGPAYRHTDASGHLTVLAGDSLPRRQEPWLNAASPGWQGSTGVGHPTEWFLTPQDGALSLQFNPPPQVSTGCTAVVRLPYVAKVSTLVDDTSVPFTDASGWLRSDLQPYHQALVHYAASRLELLRKDREASDRQLQKFLGYVQRYLQAGRQPAGQTIRPARSYFTRAHGRRDDDVGARAPWWR
jgi:hypothetical protein